MTNHDALLREADDYVARGYYTSPAPYAAAIREQAKEIERERAARDEFQERNRNQANIIKSLREQLEAVPAILERMEYHAAAAAFRRIAAGGEQP
jgi:hypothetical protein